MSVVDLHDYLRAVRERWILVVSMFLLAVSAAGATSYLITPQYEATTRLFVSTPGSPDGNTQYQGNLFSQERVLSYAEIIGGQRVAQIVIDDLDLSMTAEQLAGQVSAEVVPETVLLDATVTDPSPEQAETLANAVGSAFITLITDLETPDGAASPSVSVTVVESADRPTAAVTPNIPLNLGLGALVGLLLGFGLAILRAALDNTVKSTSDVADATHAPTIGAVMFDDALRKGSATAPTTSHSKGAETYRQIRTNLQFVDVDNPPRVLVVTSAVAGEGKTTTAINLALVLAQSGKRVALLEADLRRPRVTRYMHLVSGAGLTNVLSGMASLDDVIQPYGDGKLTVVAAGPHPPNPSELLGSAHMRSTLLELRDRHDYVVIDAPPLLPVTDAAVLSVHADGAVIVAKYGVTKLEQLRMAAQTLSSIDAKHLGTILNMVPQKATEYGYGYGYESDDKSHRGGTGERRTRTRNRKKRKEPKSWREY